MMRILLVDTLNPADFVETYFPHLGLGYLAASLKAEFKLVRSGIAEAVRSWKPDVAFITSVSEHWPRACAYARICKSAGVPVIVGGAHISALPECLTPDMDVAVIGEGERTIIELMGHYQSERRFAPVDGVVYCGVQTHPRALIPDLDSLPFPDRDVIWPIKEHSSMFTSRGCPYRCRYCFSARFWNKVRLHSAEYVVDEMTSLKQYHVQTVTILDDLFTVSRKRLIEIDELMKRRDLKLDFICNVRSNLVDDDQCRLLSHIGVKAVGMGIESASPRTLAYLKGDGNITIDDHSKAIETLRKWGIHPHPSFIIGSPDETREEILQTLKFIKAHRLKDYEVYVLIPFPGTPLWADALERRLVSNDMDFNRLQWRYAPERSVHLSRTLSVAELDQLYHRFQKEANWVTNTKHLLKAGLARPYRIPSYLLRQIEQRDSVNTVHSSW